MADQASTEGDIHELEDIVVEEVSMVDRAANKRRFLLVKSANGRVEMSDAAKDDKAAAEKAAADKATADKVAADKVAADKAVADEAATAKAAADKGAADKEAADEAATAKAAADKEAADKEAAEKSGDVDAIEQQCKQLIAKAGARMARDRFTRFKQGIDLLMAVFTELSPEEKAGLKSKADDADDPDEAKAAAVKVTPDKAAADKAAADKEAADKEAAEKAAAEKAASGDPRDAQIEKLSDDLQQMRQLVKGQHDKVTRLEKSRGAGRARSPEGGSKPPPKAVSWPSDMNRPINQDTVTKERWLD